MSKQIITLNCFFISLIINLTFLIILSLYNEKTDLKSENKFFVELISSSKAEILQNYSDGEVKNNYFSGSGSKHKEDKNYLSYETYRSIVREIAPISHDSNIIRKISESIPNGLSYIKDLHYKAKNVSVTNNIQTSKITETSVREARNTKDLLLNFNDLIDKLNGYYNMPVIYMDNDSYNISKNILIQLANAMNRWSQVKIRVTNERLRLDDPKILKIPMIYIAVQKSFTFSENIRQNLRKYLSNGGFLMFSNVANSEIESREVANSFGFELWNILGDNAHNLTEIEKSHFIFNYPFNIQNARLPDILSISKEGKIFVIYEDTGYGKAWLEGINSNTETYMKMGINIITYMLITSEISIN